jgi:hypothetical protein
LLISDITSGWIYRVNSSDFVFNIISTMSFLKLGGRFELKFIKKFFLVCLMVLCALGTTNAVKAGDNVDRLASLEYMEYLRVDVFATGIFADVPANVMPKLREWLEKRKRFKINGERSTHFLDSEQLAKKVYDRLGERYNIPQDLIPYFLIDDDRSPYCYFSSFMPENLEPQAKSILPGIRAKFHKEKDDIISWMKACEKACNIIPLKSVTCTIL